MAFGDSQLASAADSAKICSDGPGSAALVSRLSLMAIVGFQFFFFPQFGTYEQTKISKNQKHLLQKVLDMIERNVMKLQKFTIEIHFAFIIIFHAILMQRILMSYVVLENKRHIQYLFWSRQTSKTNFLLRKIVGKDFYMRYF